MCILYYLLNTFSYVSSLSSQFFSTFSRKEMCPELGSLSSYTIWATRYDNRTSKCYMTGQVGPCGKNMIFYSLPNDLVYGECDCNYDIECKSLIYSHVYDQCFYAYEQVKYINPLFSNALTLNTHHHYHQNQKLSLSLLSPCHYQRTCTPIRTTTTSTSFTILNGIYQPLSSSLSSQFLSLLFFLNFLLLLAAPLKPSLSFFGFIIAIIVTSPKVSPKVA